MGRPFKCLYCGSTHTIARGTRRTQTRGEVKVRECRACRRRFTPRSQRSVATRAPVGKPACDPAKPSS
jgi:transcriptional regulator NrdR family protein